MVCSLSDTIVAVSSPPGAAARGLLRLSGDGALEMLRQWVRKEPAALPEPRRMVPARLVGKNLELPVLLVRFAAPSSYTGQDMVEIQLPGHPALLDRMVQEAMDFGACLAEPQRFRNRIWNCRLCRQFRHFEGWIRFVEVDSAVCGRPAAAARSVWGGGCLWIVTRGASARRSGGVGTVGQAVVQLGSDHAGNLEHVVGRAHRRFQIPSVEDGEEVVGQHGHEPEDQDGVGLVPVHVIGVPAVGGLVESLVLDRPAAMAELHHGPGRSRDLGQRGDPEPVGNQFFELLVQLPTNLTGLEAANDTDGVSALRPSGEALEVPALATYPVGLLL